MAQRISRAEAEHQGVRRAVRAADARGARGALGAVLYVYLNFSEGYTSSSGPTLHRDDLSGEAIRLTRACTRSSRTTARSRASSPLMLLTDARRAARTGPLGG